VDKVTELAIERTRISYEQTLQSWIRTATSLITFGFSVYKFFQIESPPPENRSRLFGPRQFGLALVSLGVVALILASWDHRANLRRLGVLGPGRPRSLAIAVAAVMSAFGVLALAAMIARQ
jgi:putative membrane protein